MWETISNPQPVSSMLDLQALPQTETPLEVQPQRLRDALCDGRYGVEIGIWFHSPHKLTLLIAIL